MTFIDLPVGARFRRLGKRRVWEKIGLEIAKYQYQAGDVTVKRFDAGEPVEVVSNEREKANRRGSPRR